MMLVLDSSAMLAFLRDEEGADVVQECLENNACCAHALCFCEVHYIIRRSSGAEGADRAIDLLDSYGVLLRDDMDTRTWKDASAVKADYAPISLADCFCAALAKLVSGEVVTTDSDFAPLAEAGLCPVQFIR